MGPLMDVPCSDYVFVLVDNVVRIFSLGSSTQVCVCICTCRRYACTYAHMCMCMHMHMLMCMRMTYM